MSAPPAHIMGTLLFCRDCGNLLEPSTGDENMILKCDCCGAANQDFASKTVTTTSKPSAFPSELRLKLSAVQQIARGDIQTEATINIDCPECGHHSAKYHAVQLRGADEGSTVFYTCENETCGAKWNTNN